ncbi:hypothetical protein M0804_009566 [Polistes exclamans]|nr:hypothetical protein M0804_009566 [Polistes exclamans]
MATPDITSQGYCPLRRVERKRKDGTATVAVAEPAPAPAPAPATAIAAIAAEQSGWTWPAICTVPDT